MSRILIAGGGTAGHVVPALALADVLSGRGHEVAFCGTERGMEKDLVPRAGYPFSVVRIRGFERRLGLSTLRTLGSIPLAASTPGRCCAPTGRTAWWGWGPTPRVRWWPRRRSRGIPTVAVEMDSHMGWTNRILSKLVDRVCLSFPRPSRTAASTSTPAGRCGPRFSTATREQGLARFGLDAGRPVLLVFGGSLGAHTLNEAAVDGLRPRADAVPDPARHRASGTTGCVAEALDEAGANPDYQAFPFLDDFPLALAAADAVVARAGGSVAEILARGVPSLLVPYPYAAGDHQTKNARMVAAEGAALTVADADLDAERLAAAVDDAPRSRGQPADAGGRLAAGPARRG